jgi:hypothetical protein
LVEITDEGYRGCFGREKYDPNLLGVGNNVPGTGEHIPGKETKPQGQDKGNRGYVWMQETPGPESRSRPVRKVSHHSPGKIGRRLNIPFGCTVEHGIEHLEFGYELPAGVTVLEMALQATAFTGGKIPRNIWVYEFFILRTLHDPALLPS